MSAAVRAVLVAALVAAGLAVPAVALASPMPVLQRPANAVTADGLPTVQTDGIVWSQTLIGNTDYAGGSFQHSRPAGAAIGDPSEIPAYNLIRFDITTGNQDTSWRPVLNGQVIVVAHSHDGKTLYVGGDFTTVNGQPRNRIAAFDTATGQLIGSFNPGTGGEVRAIAVSTDDSTVYAGGSFGAAAGVARNRLAAFAASTGALLSWAPSADNFRVNALVTTPDGSKVIIGGAFTTFDGLNDGGLVAVSAATGAMVPYPVKKLIHDTSPNDQSAVLSLSLSSDGSSLFGTGYTYLHGGGNLEGTFQADSNSGNLIWVEDCHGDSYGAAEANGIVYVVSHEHYCADIDSFGDTNPRTAWYRTTAFTKAATGTLAHQTENNYFDWYGTPSPTQLNWYPYLATGNISGATQAAWSVVANSSYVIEGGEFPSVNQVAQQSLVRFAVPSIAPRKQGPRLPASTWLPKLIALSPTSVRVSITGNWDRDDQNLTYTVQRQDVGTRSTQAVVSNFWDEPTVGYTDTGLTPGATYNYRVNVNDPDGNTVIGTYVPITMPASGGVGAYETDVINDGARDYWRLDESTGRMNADVPAADTLKVAGTVKHSVAGALLTDSDTAMSYDGSTATATGTVQQLAPAALSEEVWFKTSSTSGGLLMGFLSTTYSTFRDRVLYLDQAGHLWFGVAPSSPVAISSGAAYNDGNWHYAVAELSGAGLALYVDGVKVAGNTAVTQGWAMDGFWRLGGDTLTGWPNAPGNFYGGALDEPAVYPYALSAAQIQQHYLDSGRSLSTPTAPSDAYGQRVFNDNPALYWRLDDAGGPTVADASGNNVTGQAAGGLSYGTASPVTTVGRAVTFNGSTGVIGSRNTYSNPSGYAEEAWFQTASTSGGEIIGFGNNQTSTSTTVDRLVYLTPDGHLGFGVNNGTMTTITSANTYNDNKWHHVVAAQGGDGMHLYVDGAQVASNGVTTAGNYVGYWRVGGDSTAGWPNPPTTGYLAGAIDEAAVYLTELSAAQVFAHYHASPASPNQPPAASFTVSCPTQTCSFDASGSSDPEGFALTYAWDFGDGTTGSGVTPSHGYAAGGNYPVKLTVTDDRGATNAVTHTASPPATTNQPPVAAFSSHCVSLGCSFDASASTDPDGTVAGYAWNFGDGSTGSGVTASHSYAAGGTYTVTLTVTDNQGATGTASAGVSPVPPLAQDAFNRTVSGGFGSAPIGGAWALVGTASKYNVTPGTATASLVAGSSVAGYLTGVSALNSDSLLDFSLDKNTAGSGTYVWLAARHQTSKDEYRLRVKNVSTGVLTLSVSKVVGATETMLASVTVTGVTFAPGVKYRMRFDVTGSATVTLQGKVWPVSGTEPGAWMVSATDASSPIPAGAPGFVGSTSSTETNSPITLSLYNLLVNGL
jgi:PKD repeat protein